MKIDLSFQCNYTIEILEELDTGERYYYPDAATEGGADGIIVKVISVTGMKWVGVFAFGQIGSKSMSGVYCMPDPDKFCVVSRGVGYIVSSSDPTNWQNVKAVPITYTIPIKAQSILVFVDHTELVAYNASGFKWRTERLSYDSFKIIDVNDSHIIGEFWNIRNEANDLFKIDLQNGMKFQGLKVF